MSNEIYRMQHADEAEALMKEIQKRFHEDKLTAEDLKHVEVVENKKISKVKAMHGFAWEIEHYDKIFGGGEIAGFLDRRSKTALKRMSWPYLCKLLVIKPNTMMYIVFLEGGFYHFNPQRKKPDSVISFKKM